MKNLMILLFTLSTSLLTAQTICTWTGGTPGKENAWNEARNWDTNRVPDEFTFVVIQKVNSGHNAQPEIKQEIEIAGLDILNNAKLTILKNGNLKINGLYTATNGIQLFGGELINFGNLELSNIDSETEKIDIARVEIKEPLIYPCIFAELYNNYKMSIK